MLNEALMKLLRCYPRSIINPAGEFIAVNDRSSNDFFRLIDCSTEDDLKCKVLEFFSRPAYKTEPYNSQRKNAEYHADMLIGLNRCLETNFSPGQIESLYSYVGNRCNHARTVRFVASGYDMNVLVDDKEA